MNLTIEKVKEILKSQEKTKSLQFLMAQDMIKLYEKIEELEGEIDDWERTGHVK